MINAVLAIETKEFVHEGYSLGPRLEFPVPIIEKFLLILGGFESQLISEFFRIFPSYF